MGGKVFLAFGGKHLTVLQAQNEIKVPQHVDWQVCFLSFNVVVLMYLSYCVTETKLTLQLQSRTVPLT